VEAADGGAGRRERLRALAGAIPDCVLLLRRLMRDPRLSRPRTLLLALAVGYLAFPIDLVPDFIPVIGQLDDAVIAALALRSVVRGAGEEAIREHWPGPDASLRIVLRLAGVRPRADGP
jgi:uncharacterized membrane protein YkvA (DUF1232 family)